nr:hypothetical protein [Streptomyces hygroscopicus]
MHQVQLAEQRGVVEQRVVRVDGVPRLLEEGGESGPFARDHQRCADALADHRVDADLRSGEELFDQDVFLVPGNAGPDRSARGRVRVGDRRRVVDSQYAEAAGQSAGLDHDRVADLLGRGHRLFGGGHRARDRLRYSGGVEDRSAAGLVPAGLYRLRRIAGKAEFLGDPCDRAHQRLVEGPHATRREGRRDLACHGDQGVRVEGVRDRDALDVIVRPGRVGRVDQP